MIRGTHNSRLAFLALLLLALPGYADPAPEYKMKAAFLYNFALLTEWPKTTEPTLRLCIMGQDQIDEALHEIDGQEVNGRKLQVVRLSGSAAVKGCQILFFGEVERASVKMILRDLGDAPVLTIGDDVELAKSGVMLLMYPESRRLVFRVNAESLKRARLTLSARLLRLARSVD